MLMQNVLQASCSLLLFCFLVINQIHAQSCDWLQLNSTPAYAASSEIDISGNKVTVEAKFIRTTPYTGGPIWAGDLVSKHKDPVDVNYLLRPNSAEITTTNGYYITPEICEIELNKVYHAALVYDGFNLKFYRNGFLMSEIAATGNLIQNDWKTVIGYYEAQLHPENFIGYIDEVRIWNYARSQDQIRTYMNISLPTPAAQVGLLAYYTFDDLENKQGNAAYDLTLSPSNAFADISTPDCSFIVDSCDIVVAPPDSVVITNDITMCAGSHQQIKTHPADSYVWTPATYLDDPTSSTPTASPPESITYYVEAYIAASNTTIRDSIHIRVEKSQIKANEDTTICAGSHVQMNVTQGTSFNWSPQQGLSNANIPNPVATPLTTMQYVVIGIGDNRCASSDTVLITVLPKPALSMSNDTLVCRGVPVQLSANGAITYEWSPSSTLSNHLIPNPVALTNTSTMYKVKAMGNNGCVSEDSVNIQVRPYPEFTTSGSKTVCEGDQVMLTASGGTTYQWTPAPAVHDPDAPATIATPTGANTLYSVHIMDEVCGNDTTINLNIVVNQNPIITIAKSNDINCQNPTAQLVASGANSYFWTPFTYLDDGTSSKPMAAVDTTTTFAVTGYTKDGCSDTASVTVKVDKGGVPRFVVPNAFTPNGDGHNDCFGIRNWGNAKIQQFSIYNRWGLIVFQAKNPSQCWDGKFRGVLQDAGGYIYIIDANTFCGRMQRKGMLFLVR
jgi:gliding motility-associated-like protein